MTIWQGVGIFLLLVIGGLGIGLKVQTSRLHTAQDNLVAKQQEFDTFKTKVKAEGDAQNLKTKITITEQQQIAQESANEATSLRPKLSQYLAARRVRKPAGNPSGSQLSAVPETAKGTDATAAESGTCPARTEADQGIIDSAAQDALTVLLWQKWADEQATAFSASSAAPADSH